MYIKYTIWKCQTPKTWFWAMHNFSTWAVGMQVRVEMYPYTIPCICICIFVFVFVFAFVFLKNSSVSFTIPRAHSSLASPCAASAICLITEDRSKLFFFKSLNTKMNICTLYNTIFGPQVPPCAIFQKSDQSCFCQKFWCHTSCGISHDFQYNNFITCWQGNCFEH